MASLSHAAFNSGEVADQDLGSIRSGLGGRGGGPGSRHRGEEKSDLSALWVYTFRCLGLRYLLGYTRDDSVRLVYLEAAGPHEKFYRDLKR
ncbi:type II toxin-antitoxin system RelE/ParE family toxin [Thauera aromatica]|uniref:type II toxin-antitoxin system RelE/ParE family toxin n=1 Tax=Thauera aromatica TaxID=59405 RepID=UPI001FFDB825|nr:type II toxin-antitoxin system RelE/ParE family toxin [Thauera aromatica]MCK2087989.1 type II toxin-antitoxin system RelE/ParE family toxin [Thauera aromatica]